MVLAGDAKKQAKQLAELGFANLPICMAKTQFSFSDDQTKLGAPRGFKITVREIKVNAGAASWVAKTGNIMIMPRPAQGARCRAHRHRRQRQDHRPVLI